MENCFYISTDGKVRISNIVDTKDKDSWEYIYLGALNYESYELSMFIKDPEETTEENKLAGLLYSYLKNSSYITEKRTIFGPVIIYEIKGVNKELWKRIQEEVKNKKKRTPPPSFLSFKEEIREESIKDTPYKDLAEQYLEILENYGRNIWK